MAITIGIISGKMNVVTKGQEHHERINLIMSLRNEGLSHASIAERLNEMGLERPRGGPYEAQSVNMTIYQWGKRERRKQEHNYFLRTIRVVVK